MTRKISIENLSCLCSSVINKENSPWPAPGVPEGDPDFKGESPDFLKLLQAKVIPGIEQMLRMNTDVERSLVGVSMSGLFALWQWMECDTFKSIASLISPMTSPA